jgi:glucokinase-like ROK family protein
MQEIKSGLGNNEKGPPVIDSARKHLIISCAAPLIPMSTKSSADQFLVRELNLSTVLRMIHNDAPLSRAQLAVRTGLNKSTISSLVEELLARGLIHEIGLNFIGTGRPATLLEINSEAGCIIGVELGVDFVAVVLTDFMGAVLWRSQEAADPAESLEQTLDQTLSLVNKAIAASRKINLSLIGIGLAIPGTVNVEKGTLIFAPNLQWHNIPIRDVFSKPTGLRVYLENDANAAAVAEHLFGAARQSTDFLFVFAGVGIGGGLFLNGKLYRGKSGFAGEIGHSPIKAEPADVLCHCGNRGCWETYVNQASILERMQNRLDGRRDSLLAHLMEEQHVPLSISLIKQAADSGDQQAAASIAEAGAAMGQGFANLINIFNPEKIILGGPLSIAGDYLLPAIRQTVREHSLPEIDQQVDIELSAFGPDASLIGAVAIVVDDILSNPTLIERR